MTRAAALALAAALTATSARADAPPAAARPEATLPAVAALVAASATRIPPASTCAGRLPGATPPTLGALFASRLAYLDRGENRVQGGCTPGAAPRCRVLLTHADGEDVASAEFRFRTTRGRLDPASLTCVLTP